MKKLFKILGIGVGIVVVLFVALIVYVTMFVDINEYRDKISQQVKQETGRELTIKGDLALSYFPWIGVTIGQTSLGNAPGFGDQPFAQVDRIDIHVKILPLLSQTLVMDTLTIEGARLNLVKNKQGKTNWEDLSQPSEKKPEKEADTHAGEREPLKLDIGGINIDNAQLSWRDQQAGTDYQIEDLNLKTGAIASGEPVRLELGFTLHDKLAKRRTPFNLSGKLLMKHEQQSMSLTDMKLALANLELSGSVQGSQMHTAPQMQIMLDSNEFVPRDTFKALGVAPPVTTDPTVFGKAKLSLAINMKPQLLEVSQLMLRLDDSTLKGNANVNLARAGLPGIRYELDVDQIDVDRYLAPATDKPKTDKPAATGDEEIALPREMLRNLDVKGTVKVGQLKVSNLKSQDMRMTLTAKNGQITIHPAVASMYGGQYSGNISIDVRSDVLKLSMDEKLTGIQAAPLFKDALDLGWIEGTANLTAKLSGQGNSVNQIRSRLNGDAGFAFLDGAIKGVNIPLKIRQAYATIKGQPAPPDEPAKTDFTSMTGTAKITNGVVNNNDLELASPLIRVDGAGSVDLVQSSMDYLVKAKVVASLQGQGGDNLEKLKGVTVPVRIKGPFSKLKYKVELEDILKQEVKKKVKEKVEEKVKEKVEDKVQDKLKDRLKGFF